jgi:hypothetical protein
VPLGGNDDSWLGEPTDSFDTALAVHLLEASTGRERHTLSGLEHPKLADLDGDGLPDLWGSVYGGLRAFRGEAPEVWRALGQFEPMTFSENRGRGNEPRHADLDRDGISDVLMNFVGAPDISAAHDCGSHTALARSGRDGHVIRKRVLEPWQSWFQPDCGECYGLSAFASRDGDFDGDGASDVIVTKNDDSDRNVASTPAATLPVEVL